MWEGDGQRTLLQSLADLMGDNWEEEDDDTYYSDEEEDDEVDPEIAR